MANRQPATITDVARRANVSAGTVSNALTGKRPVSERTRERILRAIAELGYQPNLLARSLVNRSSNTLGVATSGLEYYGPSRTLVGMEQATNELGYSLLLDLLHRPEDENVDAVLDDLVARRVDGIIWAVHEVGANHRWIDDDRLRSLPPIIFLTMETRPNTSIISTDNRAGARLAVRHLIERGRRAIGIITGPLDWWEARERLAGWRNCLQEAGLDASREQVAEGNWTAASGAEGLRQLLLRRPDLEAVFACNDQMALGALRQIHATGRQVPQDLALVGFDNTPESAFFWPPLTTIRQHLADIGRVAVQELHRIIEARSDQGAPVEPVVRLLEPELVVRESTVAMVDAAV